MSSEFKRTAGHTQLVGGVVRIQNQILSSMIDCFIIIYRILLRKTKAQNYEQKKTSHPILMCASFSLPIMTRIIRLNEFGGQITFSMVSDVCVYA